MEGARPLVAGVESGGEMRLMTRADGAVCFCLRSWEEAKATVGAEGGGHGKSTHCDWETTESSSL